MKRLVRPLSGPVLERLEAIEQRTQALTAAHQAADVRLGELSHALSRATDQYDRLVARLEAMLAIESRTAQLEERIEVLRTELTELSGTGYSQRLAAAEKTLDELLDRAAQENAMARKSRRELVSEILGDTPTQTE